MTDSRDGDRDDAGDVPPAAGLDRVGLVLRETYGADNHDSLGNDLTGLMLELARVEGPATATPAPTTPPVPSAPVPSWFSRLFGRPRR